MKRILMTFAMSVSLLTGLSAQPQLREDNIDEILGALTLEEKAALMVGSGWGSMAAGAMTASDASLVPGAAGTTRAVPRLGIPQTVVADGPAGVRIDPVRNGADKDFYATGFPTGTSMASTWNTELVETLTFAMGEEVKEYGVDVLLGPGLNLQRNPLCGRNFEYFSEDPLLSGKMAAAYVRGIQRNGVGVSAKHFAFNNQETNRMENDVLISPRAARELYLKGFEIMVKESAPWTIMSSYNKVNGTYAQQNTELLTTVLRDEWGYRGLVMTDWGSKQDTGNAVTAGNDLMMPGMDYEIGRIVDGVNRGEISLSDVDRNVRNLLEYIVKTPRFKGYKYSDSPDLEAHASLVRRASAEGMVLLENRGVLPLKGIKTVALYGVGSYDFIAGGTGSGNVNKAYTRNIAEGLRDNGLEIDAPTEDWYERHISLKRAERANTSDSRMTQMLGGDALPELSIPRSYIEQRLAVTDVAVLTISRNAGEGQDRKAVSGDWTLTGEERDMMQTLADVYHAAGKKLIVVLNIGGVIETDSWKKIPDAILLAWTPGQEGGLAVADVLTGEANPSGKLPMTFPVSYLDIPSSWNFPYSYTGEVSLNPFSSPESEKAALAAMFGITVPKTPNIDYTDYKEGLNIGYRYFLTKEDLVSYPFGYGLSYTDYDYTKPKVKVGKDGLVSVSVTVSNTGAVAGKEAVQFYVGAPSGGLEKPVRELKAFAKTGNLRPGESETLTVTLDPYLLASFNEDKNEWETADGLYRVFIGASSTDIRAEASFSLPKSYSWSVKAKLNQ